MDEHLDLNSKKLDEQLADFTDKLLSEDQTMDVAALTSQDSELQALQKTVMLLRKAVTEQQPSSGMSNRIRSGLVDEWRQMGTDERREPARGLDWGRDLLRRLGQPFSHQRRRNLALGFVVVMVALLLVVVLLTQDSGFNLTAAAGMGDLGLPLILALVLVGGGILWWLFRSKK